MQTINRTVNRNGITYDASTN